MNESILKPPQTPLNDPLNLLEERERAISLLSFLPELKTYTVYCARTGVPIATMELLQQAGKLPYLSNWKDSVAYHPIFSLSQVQLLSWVRKNWNQLFRSYTKDDVSHVQKQQFCIAFVAILHSCNCLEQEVPILPAFDIVNTNMQRLLELAYWYNYLDSQRFSFPVLRVNKRNNNASFLDIGAYLDICHSRRLDWETSKDARLEDVKLEAARRAEKLVRASHIKAVSKKALWNWFLSSLASSNSKKYSLPEWEEWKEESAKLFFGSTNQQLQYSTDDVVNIEEVFLLECTLGTTVSHAFQQELSRIRTSIDNHNKIFEIDWEATYAKKAKRVDEHGNDLTTHASEPEELAPPEAGEEPKLNQFYSRIDYIRAQAKWHIRSKQRAAWEEKHGKIAAPVHPHFGE